MIDVLIVGAGLSGLTTALKIHQKEPSLKLQILESTNEIGGQIVSTPNGEMAGKYFTPDQDRICNLLAELRIPTRRRTPVSRNLKRSWAIDNGPFASIAKYELHRYMDDLDLKSKLFRPGTYELKAKDRAYSMLHHIRGRMFFTSSRLFMINLVRLMSGADAADISYVEFMNVVHSCGGLRTLMDLYLNSSPTLLEFSSEKLLEALESRLKSVAISKMSKVMEIQHFENNVQVRDLNGTIHSASTVVLAIPWNQIIDIFITPPIPAEIEVPYPWNRYYITSFHVQYNESHWRRKGLSGNICLEDPPIYAQEYKPASLVGYLLHEDCFALLAQSTILKTLTEIFGNEMSEPVSYNQQTFEQTSLLNLPQTAPWHRIIWSSTSTATLNRGFMSGAVQSGVRAALNVLMILRPQNVTWQDLAEVQNANVVYRYPGCWELLKSSMNIYNTVYYTGTALLMYYMIKNRNKILNLC